jgi:hypothetical protein
MAISGIEQEDTPQAAPGGGDGPVELPPAALPGGDDPPGGTK